MVHYLILLSTRVDFSSHFHPGFCCAPHMISLFRWYQLSRSIHLDSLVMRWRWTDKWLLCHLHSAPSTGMKDTGCSIHHLASSYISSSKELAPLSPHGISASVSQFESEWQNLRVSIMPESILSSKRQFASSKLSINRNTWATHESAVIIYI